MSNRGKTLFLHERMSWKHAAGWALFWGSVHIQMRLDALARVLRGGAS